MEGEEQPQRILVPMATHQADAIVAAGALGDGHRFWVVPSARAGELGVLTRPAPGGGWQRGTTQVGISPALLQGQISNHGTIANALIRERLEVTGNPSRLLELLRQASQRE